MSSGERPYLGRVAALATRHGKEAIVAPILASAGLEIVVADVDTDRFGTFSGEIPRRGTPLDVAERKARAAISRSGLDLGLASEGSFGPDPMLPFTTSDVELVVLVDDVHGIVVHEQSISLGVAVTAITVGLDIPDSELIEFCRRAGFPNQGLICRPADGRPERITKAITTADGLRRSIELAATGSSDRMAIVEPDLRAHLCPSRRPVIAAAAARLAARLERRCPACGSPGFGRERFEPGRRCGWCHLPTEQPAARVESCPRCEHEERQPTAGAADPVDCRHCNP